MIEFLGFVCFALFLMYWMDSLRARDIAREAGRSACRRNDVVFLDDTVALDRLRIIRGSHGHLVLRRWYHFEFTADGDHRYRGTVNMTAKRIDGVDMEAWRIPFDD